MKPEEKAALAILLRRMAQLPPEGTWGIVTIERCSLIGGWLSLALKGENEERAKALEEEFRKAYRKSGDILFTLAQGLLDEEERPPLWKDKEREWGELADHIVTGRGIGFLNEEVIETGRRVTRRVLGEELEHLLLKPSARNI